MFTRIVITAATVVLLCDSLAAQTRDHAAALTHPGTALRIPLEAASASAVMNAWFGSRPLITFRKDATWFALVGVPLDQIPGEYIISFRGAQSPTGIREFIVKPPPPPRRADTTPFAGDDSDSDSELWWWEAPALKKALAKFDTALQPQLTFTAPLATSLVTPFGSWISEQTPLQYMIGIVYSAAAAESTVLAPARGRVVGRIQQRGCDPGLLIDHGGGLFSVLCGLHKISAEVGGMVEQRQPIATLAADNNKPKAMLHWSVSMNQNWIDPLSLPHAFSDSSVE